MKRKHPYYPIPIGTPEGIKNSFATNFTQLLHDAYLGSDKGYYPSIQPRIPVTGEVFSIGDSQNRFSLELGGSKFTIWGTDSNIFDITSSNNKHILTERPKKLLWNNYLPSTSDNTYICSTYIIKRKSTLLNFILLHYTQTNSQHRQLKVKITDLKGNSKFNYTSPDYSEVNDYLNIYSFITSGLVAYSINTDGFSIATLESTVTNINWTSKVTVNLKIYDWDGKILYNKLYTSNPGDGGNYILKRPFIGIPSSMVIEDNGRTIHYNGSFGYYTENDITQGSGFDLYVSGTVLNTFGGFSAGCPSYTVGWVALHNIDFFPAWCILSQNKNKINTYIPSTRSIVSNNTPIYYKYNDYIILKGAITYKSEDNVLVYVNADSASGTTTSGYSLGAYKFESCIKGTYSVGYAGCCTIVPWSSTWDTYVCPDIPGCMASIHKISDLIGECWTYTDLPLLSGTAVTTTSGSPFSISKRWILDASVITGLPISLYITFTNDNSSFITINGVNYPFIATNSNTFSYCSIQYENGKKVDTYEQIDINGVFTATLNGSKATLPDGSDIPETLIRIGRIDI